MSVASRQVGCTGCGYEDRISHSPMCLIYRIPGNHYLEEGRKTGWCAACNAVRDIEPELRLYPAKDELYRLNNQTDSLSFKFGRWLRKLVGAGINPIVDRIAVLERTIWLASVRDCDPRCLSCGSERTVPLNFNDRGVCTTFIHSCGGRLHIKPSQGSGFRASCSTEYVYLDPQGVRVSGEGLTLPDDP